MVKGVNGPGTEAREELLRIPIALGEDRVNQFVVDDVPESLEGILQIALRKVKTLSSNRGSFRKINIESPGVQQESRVFDA
jgi:hypothetical protein